MQELEQLSQEWIMAKEAEKRAVAKRRECEDKLTALLGVKQTLEGTESHLVPGLSIKIVGRLDRKVDADKAQEIAAEAGLNAYLSTLFRWKPEVNMAAWKSTDSQITELFSHAVTVTPGRPSYTITIKE